jgi:hypothetical protein
MSTPEHVQTMYTYKMRHDSWAQTSSANSTDNSLPANKGARSLCAPVRGRARRAAPRQSPARTCRSCPSGALRAVARIHTYNSANPTMSCPLNLTTNITNSLRWRSHGSLLQLQIVGICPCHVTTIHTIPYSQFNGEKCRGHSQSLRDMTMYLRSYIVNCEILNSQFAHNLPQFLRANAP